MDFKIGVGININFVGAIYPHEFNVICLLSALRYTFSKHSENAIIVQRISFSFTVHDASKKTVLFDAGDIISLAI